MLQVGQVGQVGQIGQPTHRSTLTNYMSRQIKKKRYEAWQATMSNGRDPAQVQVQAQEATRTTTTKHNIGIELMKAAGAEIPTAGTLDKPPEPLPLPLPLPCTLYVCHAKGLFKQNRHMCVLICVHKYLSSLLPLRLSPLCGSVCDNLRWLLGY